MKKQYSAPEVELIKFNLSTAVLSGDLVLTSNEDPNGSGTGMGELPTEPGIDLDGLG